MIANFRFTHFGGCCLLLALFCGNVPAKPPEPVIPTFFPPAPDEPRIQFLSSFSSDADLGKKKTFLSYITGERTVVNALVKPYGLASQAGKIYVCDTMRSAVEVFDLIKKRADYFAPRGEGRLQTPVNITIDEDGTRYVADTGRNQVVIFDKNGVFLSAIGRQGEMKPCDVAVTADRLYIADIKGHVVQVYSKTERQLLFTIPRDPKAAEGKLFSPTNLALDKQGRLLVSDIGAFAVAVYDLEGNYLRTIGQQGVAPGLFARPKGVAVDPEGLAYVVDAATEVVQLFDAEGKLLLFFGQPGATTRGELSLPAAVKLDYENVGYFQKHVAPGYRCKYLILVTSQFGNHKVNVYGFLEKE